MELGVKLGAKIPYWPWGGDILSECQLPTSNCLGPGFKKKYGGISVLIIHINKVLLEGMKINPELIVFTKILIVLVFDMVPYFSPKDIANLLSLMPWGITRNKCDKL